VAKTFEEPGVGATAWFFSCYLLFLTSLVYFVLKLSPPGSLDHTPKLIIYSVVSFAGEFKKCFRHSAACPSAGIILAIYFTRQRQFEFLNGESSISTLFTVNQ